MIACTFVERALLDRPAQKHLQTFIEYVKIIGILTVPLLVIVNEKSI